MAKQLIKLLLFLVFLVFSISCGHEEVSWSESSQTAKPWTRWWWMDCAVDSQNIKRELMELSNAGIGGVEITPIYGVVGEEHRVIDFLSADFTEVLDYTIDEAHKLAMGVDLPPGSGWRCGGPFVPEEKGLWNFKVDRELTAGDTSYVLNPVKSRDKVKRPAQGGEGLTIDTFDKEVTNWYLNEFWKRLNIDENKLRCFFHDSFEYTGDYTLHFLEEFQKRRGYDLEDYLYVLAGDCKDEDIKTRIISDYRETLADLVLESFIQPMTGWASEHGSLNRNQAHGSPGNILDLYAACDIPETEFFGRIPGGDPKIFIQKFASSAAHVSGKQLVSSESFTWLDEHWTVTPTEMRMATNRFFLAGINHMFFHGTCYSPEDAKWPGWLFYASSQINNRNPLWQELPTLFKYIERTQSVLQNASPENDVLFYWPYYDVAASEGRIFKHIGVGSHTAWFYDEPISELATRLTEAGYTLDFISDKQLLASESEGDKIVTSGKSKYKAIVIPQTRFMPVNTMLQLTQFAAEGVLVVFDETLPVSVPGFSQFQLREEQLDKLKAYIAENNVGNAVEILNGNGIRAEEDLVNSGFRYLKMKQDDSDLYLVFNLNKETRDDWVRLEKEARNYVLMNPISGTISKAASKDGKVRLQLKPEEIVFIRCLNKETKVQKHNYFEIDWTKKPLKGRWKLEFAEGGPVYPGNIDLVELKSWTQVGDANTRSFAGTAKYSIQFDWDGPTRCYLDLGQVNDCARIKLNEKDFGALLGPDYGLFVDNLQAGKNELVVEVTNVAANRIKDLDERGIEWRRFKDINFVDIDYKPFSAKDWPVRPAGLLGPVEFRFQ